jgi:hypothetical protein
MQLGIEVDSFKRFQIEVRSQVPRNSMIDRELGLHIEFRGGVLMNASMSDWRRLGE